MVDVFPAPDDSDDSDESDDSDGPEGFGAAGSQEDRRPDDSDDPGGGPGPAEEAGMVHRGGRLEWDVPARGGAVLHVSGL